MAQIQYWLSLLVLLLLLFTINESSSSSIDIGVTYPMSANNLPQPRDVIKMINDLRLTQIRLYEPNHDVFKALKGKEITVALGIPQQDVHHMATGQEATNSWFLTNVAPYTNDIVFSYIVVGNELLPGEYAEDIQIVMGYLQNILVSLSLGATRVTTAISTATLETSYPPSNATFTDEASFVLGEILPLLSQTGSSLMLNLFPYYSYAADPINIQLDYALLETIQPVFVDNGLIYYNLFDAMVDAFYSAMENLLVKDVGVAIGATGWPSAGNGNFTTPQLAATYNRNFLKHILDQRGTPKRPGIYMEGFIYTIFNQNLETTSEKQNFGLFYPNMQPVYPVFS